MVQTVSRGVGFTALVAGVVVGWLLLGTYGAIAGVLITMVGFQMLTRGVEGAPYIVAGISATVGIAFIGWRHGLSWTDVGIGRSTWVTGLLWSLGIVVVVGAVIGIAGSIPRLRHLFADDRVTEVSGPVTARKALLDIPFGTVLLEEFAFRGVMLALVTTLTGTTEAVVVTSVLFGLWHISPSLEMHDSHNAASGSSWTTVVGTVFFTGLSGVGFALLRLYTGSLFPPAALHWAANGTGVVVGWVVHNLTPRIIDVDEADDSDGSDGAAGPGPDAA
jgi:membrane protease YdiL (CAAX protease family)